MKKSRKHLFLSSTILRGRRIKGPEGDDTGGGATGDSTQGGNNQGGNEPSNDGSNSNANNDGLPIAPEAFWKDPAAEGDDSGNQGDDDSKDFGTQIMTEISGWNPPKPLFDADIAKEVADGNLDGVNARFNEMVQGAVRQAVVLTAKIMQRFEGSIDQRIDGKLGQDRTRQGDEGLLAENFTSFKDPAVAPMIRGVFQQSLLHTKGDRTKALEMTRGMLRTMGQTGRNDLGIEAPPRNPDDLDAGSRSFVKDLLELP